MLVFPATGCPLPRLTVLTAIQADPVGRPPKYRLPPSREESLREAFYA